MRPEWTACCAGLVLGAAGGLMFLPGCGGRRGPDLQPTLYSLPVQNAQKIGSARYPILPEKYTGSQFEVYYQGLGVRNVSGRPVWSLRIQVSCVNHTDHAITFSPPESHVVDNRGDVIHLADARLNGKRAETFSTVPAHAHGQFDLFYDLPHRYPVEKIENFHVYWRYQIADRGFAKNTLFIRKPLDNVRYRDASGRYRSYDYFMAVQDSTGPQ